MPRDYKYRAASKKKKQPAPAWLWMLVGLVLGAFVVGLAWLKMDSAENGGPEWVGAKPDRQPQRVEKSKPPAKVPKHKPQFDFYDELGKKEVLVPDDQLELRGSSVPANARYEIQIASFARSADAERFRAELALSVGIETRVKQGAAKGKRVYRVISGPYLSRSSLDSDRGALRKNGHTRFLVRIIR